MPPPAFPGALLDALRAARHIAAFTGAGVSAESGVPTFRDAQTGLWAQFRPEELATPEAFARHPRRVWEWYAMRRRQVRAVRPNAGHRALVDLERRAPRFTLITQNVDRLHQRAGSGQVLELHGSILRARCPNGHLVIEDYQDGEADGADPPRCPHCRQWLRPDVVWFGESLPCAALRAAEAAARQCEVLLSIGTSTLVYPAAELPFLALDAGAVVVEINPQTTPLSRSATFTLAGPSGEVLPRLVAAAWPEDLGQRGGGH